MRLIDADELMEHVWRDKLDSRKLIAEMIEKAPTIKEISTKMPIDVFEKLISQEPRWIPVSERLPKACEKNDDGITAKYYLIQNEYEDMLVARYDGVGWEQIYQSPSESLSFGLYFHNEYIEDRVIAWMPLPEPYKAESERGRTREEATRHIESIKPYVGRNIKDALDMAIKALEQEPCDDEYIEVPKKALKYRTAGMVAYNIEWLKNHFDIERAVICGAQQPFEDCISREDAIKQCGFGMTSLLIADCLRRLPSVTPQPKTEVFDKIRDEIEHEREEAYKMFGHELGFDKIAAYDKCLGIIDKYKEESEDDK